jgi:hypothetical protein
MPINEPLIIPKNTEKAVSWSVTNAPCNREGMALMIILKLSNIGLSAVRIERMGNWRTQAN